jgi:hypothetical protein
MPGRRGKDSVIFGEICVDDNYDISDTYLIHSCFSFVLKKNLTDFRLLIYQVERHVRFGILKRWL